LPWPAFSELSFGFSFLREFEKLHAPEGKFPSAPDFITQNDEASKGYDVMALLENSAPVYFQFKRSFILTTRNATEIQAGDFTDPILYRMYLYEREHYRQHIALRRLESDGNSVFYVTSQIENHVALSNAYAASTIVESAAALFSPNEVNLPNYTEPHHITFKADADYGFLYSEKGIRFKRKFSKLGIARDQLVRPRRRSAADNLKPLAEFVKWARTEAPPQSAAIEIALRFDDPLRQASILAFFLLDAQLTLFRDRE
jgi:hypothetical protein